MSNQTQTASGTGAVDQKPLVLPFFRVVVTKLEGGHRWRIVQNPKWGPITRGQSMILDNAYNEYAEYTNCGCVYRMIRVETIHEYVDGRKFDPAWALDPRLNADVEPRDPARGTPD